jgi:hypothetical protein
MITPLTRRELLGSTWRGRLSDREFLSRLYDLEQLPFRGDRFSTMAEDIVRHRENNDDWEDDWIFSDDRLQLDDDELLLHLVAETAHPEVMRDSVAVNTQLDIASRALICRSDPDRLRSTFERIPYWSVVDPFTDHRHTAAGAVKWRRTADRKIRRHPEGHHGHRARVRSSCRIATASTRFMDSKTIVARPIAVRPRISPETSAMKWSFHAWILGWNSCAASPVPGSMAVVRAPFRSEHDTHASARFSSDVTPPAA